MKNSSPLFKIGIYLTAICLILILTFFIITNSSPNRTSQTESADSMYYVTAQTETEPVSSAIDNDGADEPAIWINYSQPDSSRIIGTDKTGGLGVYDLSGREVFHYNTGKMNNADLLYGFHLDSLYIDLRVVSNRTDQSVDLYRINDDGSEGTDGIDITSFSLGGRYPKGLLVVQDGNNDDNGTPRP